MDPRKKKEQSLNQDRRNTYGENDKSSRKSIRRRKHWVNQTYRRSVKQALTTGDAEAMEDNVAQVRRPNWKKCADQSLGDALLDALIQEIEALVQEGGTALLERLERHLIADGWARPGVRVAMRQLRSVVMVRWSCEFNLDLPTARALASVLRHIASEQSHAGDRVNALPDA